MTGEITLRGKVLPIGGVKEKLLAAHRVGITRIILPLDNETDLSEIPASIREALAIKLVDNIEEVFDNALTSPPSEAFDESTEIESDLPLEPSVDDGPVAGESVAH